MEQLTLNMTRRSLFEEIVSREQLENAYRQVKTNKGAPGIDGVTVEEFRDNLQEELLALIQDVKAWTYKPRPVRRVRIPKPGKKEHRMLGIPCVRDRVLQQSIQTVLSRIYEPKFSSNSFGFRPGRSQKDAIARAKQLVEEGKRWVVDIDLEKFFDTINHDRLMHRLAQDVTDKRILRLIGLTLRSGVMDEERYEPTEEGTTQGSPLSPLLSNIVLDELDKELERRGLQFCRYADDANIFVGSERAGQRVMTSITKFIEKKLKLKVNQTKSKVARAKRVRFLGLTIADKGVAISKESIKRAFEKIRLLIPRRTHQSIEKQIEKVNQWYRGWGEYYGITNFPSQLNTIEGHIRRRFRAQLVRNQKRRRHLYAKLIKQGVMPWRAREAFTARGVWALSKWRSIHCAWSNEWFTHQNLYAISSQNREHWYPLKFWKVL